MTCKDCIHYSMCYLIEHYGADEDKACVCKDFKNKADFAEVVRCKDCAYYVPIDDKQFVYNGKPAMYCFMHSATFYENDYCSYGVRSDSE